MVKTKDNYTRESDIKLAKMEVSVENIKETQYKMDEKLDKLINKIEHHIEEETKYLDKKFTEQEKQNKELYADKKIEVWFYTGCGIILRGIS